jgi:uncharacterized protein YcbK (DUF882 family)
MSNPGTLARRHFLRHTGRLAMAGAVPALAPAARAMVPGGARELALVHTHTHERVQLTFARGEQYDAQALATLNHFLRDHYTGEVGAIDPLLFELLHRVQATLGAHGAFEVISGFRCDATNTLLRRNRGGGVARRSLHLEGRALDVRLPGVPLTALRDAALSLAGGGVGYYAQSGFVHIDTGRVRSW